MHWEEGGAELVGTAILMTVGLSAVCLDFGPRSPVAGALPGSSWRLLLNGLALEEARNHRAGTVAFPSISTGAYGFPIERAARVASGAVLAALRGLPPGERPEVVICAFSDRDARVYTSAFAWAVPG